MNRLKKCFYHLFERFATSKPHHKAGALVVSLAMIAGIALPSWNQKIQISADTQIPSTVADPSSANTYETMLGGAENGGRYAGRVWFDKSVFNNSLISQYGNGKTQTYTIDPEKQESFLVVFSALGSSRNVNTALPVSLDVMFIIDVSGSMNTSTGNNTNRISQTVAATNSAIEYLMDQNPYNRVGITVFSNSSGTSTPLPLDHYSKSGTDPYVSLTNFGTATSGDNVSRFRIRAQRANGNNIDQAISVVGGTNTQYGLYRGMNNLVNANGTSVQINGKTVQRIPSVIFLSDGQPTYSSSSEDWWSPNTNQQGPGSSSYYGNGMLALMSAASMKQRIAAHYGVNSLPEADRTTYAPKIYSVGMINGLQGGNLDLANVTLNPSTYINANNDMAQMIRDAWNVYDSHTNAQLREYREEPFGSNRNGFRILVSNNGRYSLRHPNGNDAGYDLHGNQDVLKYNDGYFAADEDVSEAFQNIIQTLQNTSFVPVSETVGSNPNGGLSYTDPIGELMEVKNVKGVTLFGEFLEVNNEGNGTFSVESKILTHPVYGTQFDTGNIQIQVSADDQGNETLVVHVPSNALPIRNETIAQNGNALSYTTNNGTEAALPLRVVYSVGVQKAYLTDEKIDLQKINDSRPEYVAKHSHDGALDLYSNLYTTGEQGKAQVTYSPNTKNRYYYFQTNRVIYTDGHEGEIGKGGSVQDPATSALSSEQTYYLVVDYYRNNNGTAELVELVVRRTGAELMENDSITYIAPLADGQYYGESEEHSTPQQGDVVASKIGGVRMNRTYLFNAEKTNNPSQTATHTFSQAYNSGNTSFTVSLGNNGRLSIPNQSILVGKEVETQNGIAAPTSDRFQIEIQLTGTAYPNQGTIYEKDANGEWVQKLDQEGDPIIQPVTFTNGKATIELHKDEAIMLLGLENGVQYSITETLPDDSKYTLKAVNGDASQTNAEGTIGQNGEAEAIFTNTYTPDPIQVELVVDKSLIGRNYQTDDHYSFALDQDANNPIQLTDLPTLDVTLPTGEEANTSIASNTAALTFTIPGTYLFTLREIVPHDGSAVPGVTYDPSIYEIQVVVGTNADQSGLATPTIQYRKQGDQEWMTYTQGSRPSFENTYNNEGISRTIDLHKVLQNKTLENGEFFFDLSKAGSKTLDEAEATELKNRIASGTANNKDLVDFVENAMNRQWDPDPDQPDPSDGQMSKSNDAAGNIQFGSFDFRSNTAGTEPVDGKVYKYTIKERASENVGIKSDDTEKNRYMYVFIEQLDSGERQIRAIPFGDRSGQASTFTNTYSATKEVSLVGEKVLSGRSFKTGDSFTFEVAPLNGAPQIVDADGDPVTSITITASEADEERDTIPFDIGTIHFTQNTTGSFTYRFTEVVPEQTNGIAYDAQPKTLVVTVSDDGEGHLSVAPDPLETEPYTVHWTNTYSTQSTTPVSLSGTKKLLDQPFDTGDFTFTITGPNGNEWIVGSNASSSQADPEGNYTGTFAILNDQVFTQPGTYTYTIKENQNTQQNVTYDQSVYRVVYEVSDNGIGQLIVAEPQIQKQNGNTWETVTVVEFDNIFNGPAYTPVVTKTMLGNAARSGYTFILSGYNTATQNTQGLVLPDRLEVTSNEDGTISFDEVRFLQEGTYVLEAYEKQPTQDGTLNGQGLEGAFKSNNGRWVYQGISYDNHIARSTITVRRDASGHLMATRTSQETPNVFTNSQSLSITKQVTNLEDVPEELKATDFTFEITLKRESETGEMPVTGERTIQIGDSNQTITFDENGTGRFQLKAGQTALLYGFLENTHYTIEEVDLPTHFMLASETPIEGEIQPNTNIEAITIQNTYAAPAQLPIQITKTIDGRDFRAGDAFTFELSASEGAPVPEQSSVTITPSEGRSATGTFGNIRFSLADVGKEYDYTIREIKPASGIEGIVYDETNHILHVALTQENGQVVIDASMDGQSVNLANAAFINRYESELTWAPTLTKTVLGGKLGTYTFEMQAQDQEGLTGELDQVAQNDANGLVVFDPVTFDRAGTYRFTLKEQIPNDGIEVEGKIYADGVLYDPHEVEIDVIVSRRADGSYFIENEEIVNNVEFRNDAGLTITKQLFAGSGDEANLDANDLAHEFQFEFSAGSHVYPYVKTSHTGTISQGTIRSKDTFTLADQDKMEIFGFDPGESYSIREIGMSQPYVQLSNEGAEGEITLNASATARFKNVKVVHDPAILGGQKTLQGNRPLQAGEFTFEIEGLSAQITGEKPLETPASIEQEEPNEETLEEKIEPIEVQEDPEENAQGEEPITELDPIVEETEAELSVLERTFRPIQAKEGSDPVEIPMPAQTQTTNDENGVFQFGQIIYERPGIYRYRIKEVAGNDEEITYDENTFEAEVLVAYTDNEAGVHVGVHIESITYTNAASQPVDAPIFINTYERIPGTPHVEIEKMQQKNGGSFTKDPLDVEEGDLVTYQLSIRPIPDPIRPETARNVVVSDPIPEGLKVIEESISGNGVLNDGVIQWDLGDIEPDADPISVVFQVQVPEIDQETKPWVNAGTLAFNDQQIPSNEVILNPSLIEPQIVMHKSQSIDHGTLSNGKAQVKAGDRITYQIEIINIGQGKAKNVLVSDPIQTGLLLDRSSITPDGVVKDGMIQWDLGTLDPGEKVVVGFTVVVPQVKETTSWKNIATVTIDEEPGDPSNSVEVEQKPEPSKPKPSDPADKGKNESDRTPTNTAVFTSSKVWMSLACASMSALGIFTILEQKRRK